MKMYTVVYFFPDTVYIKTTYTAFRKKTLTYVFDYNSGISWLIFIGLLFIPMESGMNRLLYNIPYIFNS